MAQSWEILAALNLNSDLRVVPKIIHCNLKFHEYTYKIQTVQALSASSEGEFAVDLLRRIGNSSRNKHTRAVGDCLSNKAHFFYILRTLCFMRVFKVVNELRPLYS